MSLTERELVRDGKFISRCSRLDVPRGVCSCGYHDDLPQVGRGCRRICRVCLNNGTRKCGDCTWPKGRRHPTRLKLKPERRIPPNPAEVVF